MEASRLENEVSEVGSKGWVQRVGLCWSRSQYPTIHAREARFNGELHLYNLAMENFVFSDEIKTKLMKMSKLMDIFYVP